MELILCIVSFWVCTKKTDEKCDLCDELILKIEEIKRFFIIDDIILINDYVYYPQKKKFDKSQTITMFPGGGPLLRSPLSGFDKFKIQTMIILRSLFLYMRYSRTPS